MQKRAINFEWSQMMQVHMDTILPYAIPQAWKWTEKKKKNGGNSSKSYLRVGGLTDLTGVFYESLKRLHKTQWLLTIYMTLYSTPL